MCDKMINYVYDDIKPRYNDGIHMIAFDMDFSGKNRRDKIYTGDDEKVCCVWAHWHEEFEIIAMTGGTLMMSVDGTMNVLHEGTSLLFRRTPVTLAIAGRKGRNRVTTVCSSAREIS